MADMYKGYYGSLYGNYRQLKFTDVYSSAEDFLNDYKNVGIPAIIQETNANTLYYLLYARFGNDIIASSDLNRFKYSLFSIIWQYGPTWEKKLDIQDKLRNFTEEEILTGSRQIYNTASHPATEPGTDTDEELPFIDNQNTSKARRGKLEAYDMLYHLLVTDVTTEFLNRFQKLFLTIVEPELPLYYEEGIDD